MKILCLMTLVGNIFQVKLHNQQNQKKPDRSAFFGSASWFFLFVVLLLAGCDKPIKTTVYALRGDTMGTTYSIKAIAHGGVTISQAALQIQIDKELEGCNEIMSTYIEDSELSLVNRSKINDWQIISDQLFDIMTLSNQISVTTSGAFDVTVGPIVNLWGFGPDELDSIPSDGDLQLARAKIGFQNIQLNPESRELLKEKEVYIDLSAIAKGYATDVVARKLAIFGFKDFMVEIGGDLFVSGKNAQGGPWTIGIERPSIGRLGAIQAVSVSNRGVATSGDYRNYIEQEGRRISHTIDPRTGAPVDHTLASVTVVAANGAEADAYATALNVMGPNDGYRFALKNDIAAYFIVRKNSEFEVKYTPDFERIMILQ